MPLITAGSGVGLGLARHLRARGKLQHSEQASSLPSVAGFSAILAGSCSTRTNEQVANWCKTRPAFRIDAFRLAAGEPVLTEALAWAEGHLQTEPVLIYATSKPEDVKAIQARVGVALAGQLVEDALAAIAKELVRMGVRKLISAGGETSGAIVKALDIESLRIGAQIDPGVSIRRPERCRVAFKARMFPASSVKY
jgi:uncharacterized protein YgbK (DUF1537 family)